MNKEQLLDRANQLQIEVPEGATSKEIIKLIKSAETEIDIPKDDILKKATKLEDCIYKNFQFTSGRFIYKGREHFAKDAINNTQLMEELIKSKSAILKQI